MAAITDVKPKVIVPLTPEEEDQLVNTRLTMEDRQQVRRITKRWQMHINNALPHPESSEHFLLELENFRLAYRKNDIIVRSEERQVVEYQQSKTRIEEQVLQVLAEIESLKISLEESQEERRRKIAYDEIASRINELPSRAEQESQIATLLSEVAAIKEEHEADQRVREERKNGLAELNRVLDLLRIVGKGEGAVVQDSETLVQDSQANDVDMLSQEQGALADGEMEEGEEREHPPAADSATYRRQTSTLNPRAAEFQPRMNAASLLKEKVLRGGYDSSTPGPGSPVAGSSPSTYPTDSNLDRDVEMGDAQPSVSKSEFFDLGECSGRLLLVYLSLQEFGSCGLWRIRREALTNPFPFGYIVPVSKSFRMACKATSIKTTMQYRVNVFFDDAFFSGLGASPRSKASS
ncbi:hypothetical protein CPB86DRAFT_824659 [Serendipita vermifera]|nr:hypothetical protein CPB86DRAFT_824659 [Serendipita vermifera]